MKKACLLGLESAILLFCAGTGFAEGLRYSTSKGEVVIPASSLLHSGGVAHTDYVKFYPKQPANSAFPGDPGGETPGSLACVYGLTAPTPGCATNLATAVPTGGWGTIAIVDAFDNPYAESDLNTFSSQFGLPACTTANGCFSQVYASGTQPDYDPDWASEEGLDIEMAHAMAPNAKIVLVEADSASNEHLYQAEDVASTLVSDAGGGDVSNSWGDSEFPTEASYDTHFQTPGIVYFASTGDDAALPSPLQTPPEYPSTSPYVIAAGGSSITRDANGNFLAENGWSYNSTYDWGGDGGFSKYETRPSYQDIVQKYVGSARGVPDIAFQADPLTGVDIYDTNGGGWYVDGGTSVASPALAGIVNRANFRAVSTAQEANKIYTGFIKQYPEFWRAITQGNNGYSCRRGYNFVTGIGTPLTYQGK